MEISAGAFRASKAVLLIAQAQVPAPWPKASAFPLSSKWIPRSEPLVLVIADLFLELRLGEDDRIGFFSLPWAFP